MTVSWDPEYVLRRDTEQADRMRSFLGSGQLGRLLEILRSARQQKRMYFQPVDVETAVTFLNAFDVGCFACGIDLSNVFRERATNERGWEWNALGPEREMRSRGHTDEQIIDELFLIEITAWEMLKGDSEDLR
jgi:hypothetical protein